MSLDNDTTPIKDSPLISTRPVSRRGLRTSISADIPGSSDLTLAPIRVEGGNSVRGMSAAGRPLSSVRIGTASRLASAMSNRTGTANPIRTGTALSNISNMKIVDRPITQMGLTGLQTGQGRIGTAGGTRKVKDKRYWIDLIQSKIKQIEQETVRLIQEKTDMDKEISTKLKLEKKAKEAAKELTELQDKMADLNIALDSINSGISSQTLQREANALRERNEKLQSDLEKLFTENQSIVEANKKLEKEIEIAKKKVHDKILSLPAQDQARYYETQKLVENLRKEHIDLQNEIEALTQKYDYLNNFIVEDPMRAEAVRLHDRLDELEEKYETLKEEQANKLTPEQEQEKLLQDLKANNQALAKINHQIKLSEKELNDAKEELKLVEQNLEEVNSGKYAKYKELKRRDEIMTEFLSSFPEEMQKEQEKLESLKNEIAYAIEAITLAGIDLKDLGLKDSDLLNESNDLTTKAGAIKEYKRLSIQLKQLELLEQRTNAQLKQLTEEELKLMNEISHYSNVDQLRNESTEKMEALSNKLEELSRKERVTQEVLAEAKKRNQEIKEQLRTNEVYREIAHLEEKLSGLDIEIKTLQDIVKEQDKQYDYSGLRKNVDDLVSEINQILIKTNKKNIVEEY
ncbi:intraflagellar transport protein 74 homolog [Condylostylus longicornis]|uniref:intraflagellar transport protein 74 homolog n=1 Tax=Condylostylus longicornis TaxID=2530218 RepID=UPI00244DB5F1|nr:intraflagellar transport protein 74 homolog [Condylostylus longicornis]